MPPVRPLECPLWRLCQRSLTLCPSSSSALDGFRAFRVSSSLKTQDQSTKAAEFHRYEAPRLLLSRKAVGDELLWSRCLTRAAQQRCPLHSLRLKLTREKRQIPTGQSHSQLRVLDDFASWPTSLQLVLQGSLLPFLKTDILLHGGTAHGSTRLGAAVTSSPGLLVSSDTSVSHDAKPELFV